MNNPYDNSAQGSCGQNSNFNSQGQIENSKNIWLNKGFDLFQIFSKKWIGLRDITNIVRKGVGATGIYWFTITVLECPLSSPPSFVEFKIFVTGQVLGWSSVILIGTNDLFKVAMYENQWEISFVSPSGKYQSNRPNDGFVDDIVIGVTGTNLESPEKIKEEMQLLANKYDKYLFAAGERLNL